jgi:hypothetical protein
MKYFQTLVYIQNYSGQKPRIQETPNLHTNAHRSTDTKIKLFYGNLGHFLALLDNFWQFSTIITL